MMRSIGSMLERRAFMLGTANAIDFALQFLLPVVLARSLDVESFGKYRLLWLAVYTVLAISTLAMPQSLYYFLPRSDAAQKRLYINQTLLFLCLTSLFAAWALSPLDPWRPASVHGIADPQWVVPAFVFLWTVASVLDLLPTVEERITWQSKAIVGLSGLRAVVLSLVAIATGELAPVLLTLIAFVLFKLCLLLYYIARYHGLGRPLYDVRSLVAQVRHAAPIGLSGTLYGLRSQADQWVAATLFSIGMFASFSVSAVLGPLVYICRQSVTQVFLPSMSRLEAGGDLPGMLALNSRANVMVAVLAYPLLAFAFVFAEDIITLVYTDAYLEAAPAMRLYIVGMAALVVELGSIMLLLKEGKFATGVNAVLLALSVALSWYAAQRYGLAGAAAGSVVAVYCDRLLTLKRISARTGIAVSRMQDWRSLAVLLAAAVACALLVWALMHGRFTASYLIVRVVLAGALMALFYSLLAAVLNPDSRAMALLRRRAGGAEAQGKP
jgi:O-antigen/teichoic acid export membrane protein